MVRNLLDDQAPPTAAQVTATRRLVLGEAGGTDRTDRRPAAAAGWAAALIRARQAPSYRRRAAVAALGAAAAAVAVAVATVPGGSPAGGPGAPGTADSPGGPAGGSGGLAGSRGGSGGPAGGGDPATRPSPLSANQILLAAAERAERGPATGARWQLHTISGSQALTTGGYLIDHRYDTQLWVPTSATEPTWRIMQDTGSRPATPADIAAWKRAGSPTRWTIPAPKYNAAQQKRIEEKERINRKASPGDRGPMIKAKPETATATVAAPYAAREDNHGTVGVITNKPRTLAELAKLPTNPALLRAWLEREVAAQQRRDGVNTGQSMAAAVFQEGMQIAVHLPVTPALRAAAFRMMADLPGVRAVGQVRDPLGRLGYAVAMPQSAADSGSEFRLIVDTSSGNTLGYEFVITRPDPGNPHTAKVGQVTAYEAVVDSGWTNARPKLPSRQVGPEDGVG